jgi:PAS domain S-box-containing protein
MTARHTLPVYQRSEASLLARCAVRLRQTFSPRVWFFTALALAAGVAASITVHDMVMRAHQTSVTGMISGQADRAADEVDNRLTLRKQSAARYATLWKQYDEITDDRWTLLTRNYTDSKEVMAVIWVDASYAVRKITPSNMDLKSAPNGKLGETSRALQYLKRIPNTASDVILSPIVDWGADPLLFLIVPLHRKSGAFDGFLVFMHRAEAILSHATRVIDTRIGLEITQNGTTYFRSPENTKPFDDTQIISKRASASSSASEMQLKLYPLKDLMPNYTRLADTLLGFGLLVTVLLILMGLQMAYLSRARREVQGSRAQALANEQRYRSLITGCDLGWVVLDHELRVIDANEPYIRMTGREKYEDIAGRQILEWIDAAHRPRHERAREQINHISNGVTESNVDYRWPDGTIRHLHVDIAVREGRNGKEVVGLCRDVTEQDNARKDLELRNRAMEASSSAIMITAVGGGTSKVVYCNKAFENMTGYSRAEVIGAAPDFLGGDNSKANVANLQRMAQNLMAGQSTQANLVTFRKDGDRLVRHVSTTPVIGEDGRPTHVISISTDVTDEERKAEHLRLRERAIEASQNGIVIVDARQPDLPIIFANKAFEKITGYAAADVIGKNARFLQGDDIDQPEIDVIRRALVEHTSASVVMRSYRRDGGMFWNEMHIDPVIDELGTLTHFIGIITDATARKETEAQLLQVQKMDAIGQLTGGVAHDFNNLLTVVIGNSKLIQQSIGSDEKQKRRLSLVVRAAERGAELTQRLLAFSRKQTLRTEVMDVNAMVQDMQHLVQRTIGENITTNFSLGSTTCSVRVDRGQLENALLNLAINARDAMPQGGNLIVTTQHVVLTEALASRMNVRPGHYIEMAVSDTGVGMSKEVRERAFEPFFTTKEVGKGTGLGLSMVFGFVKQSEGHVSIYSEVGYGTTVKLYLPSTDAAPNDASSSTAAEAAEPENRYKVLVVEDDDHVRATTTAILEHRGFDVVEAPSAEAALHVLEARTDINIVFSDVIMPGKMNGIELFNIIQAKYPHVRMVLTSGYPREALKLDGDKPSAPLLINKPYDPSNLAKTLARYAAGGSGA